MRFPFLVTHPYIVTMSIAREIALVFTLLKAYLLPSLHISGKSGNMAEIELSVLKGQCLGSRKWLHGNETETTKRE